MPGEDSETEFKLWKKHAPLLYDVAITHSLDWPSLTCQWLPVANPVHGGDYVEHKLLLGTHVNLETQPHESNYLMIATVRLPSPEAEIKVTDFDEDKGECGGYGGSMAKIEVGVRINHPTEVNRARYCPSNHFLIATKTALDQVLLFDYSKHPNRPTDGEVRPLLTLAGHKKEGYGLAWSPVVGHHRLLSGSDDGLVCVWDVAGSTSASGAKGPATLQPLFKMDAHNGEVVEDVAWHATHADVFASVSDDRCLRIWDARAGGVGGPTGHVKAHRGHAMTVAFCPTKDHLLATGGADKVVLLWDQRTLAQPLHEMKGHEDDVLGLAWCPFADGWLASSGQDKRVVLWDTSKVGMEQDPEDAEDGPPELRFIHGGHRDRVADFSWNEKAEWFLASVADNNELHVWQPCGNLLDEEEGEGGGGGGGDGEGGGEGGRETKKARVADADLE